MARRNSHPKGQDVQIDAHSGDDDEVSDPTINLKRLPLQAALAACVVAALAGANGYWVWTTIQRHEAALARTEAALVCLTLRKVGCEELMMKSLPAPQRPSR